MHTFLNIIWNPTEGFDLGFFKLRFYSLMFVIAFGLGWYLTKKIYDREGESNDNLDKLFIYTVFATLLGARLGHVFFYDWNYYKDHLLEIILPIRLSPKFEIVGFSGLASHGAALAVILVMIYYSRTVVKKPVLWVLDRITIPVSIGGMFVRFGNFFNSEIIGYETKSALGIKFVRDRFSPSDAVNLTGIQDVNKAYDAIVNNPQFAPLLEAVIPKHPTQLYEALGYFLLFLIVLYLYWKTDARLYLGKLFGIFLVFLWGIRFVVEYLKESQGGFEETLGYLSTGQWLSIPFIVIGLYLWFSSKNRKQTES